MRIGEGADEDDVPKNASPGASGDDYRKIFRFVPRVACTTARPYLKIAAVMTLLS